MKPVLGSQINSGHPLSVGMVGCWLFNEGGGSKVADISWNGNYGTLIGTAPSWAPGDYGPVVSLSGINEYINIPKNAYDLGIRQHATFICYIYQTNSADRHLLCDYNLALGFALRIETDRTITFFIYPNNHRISGVGNVPQDTWSQIVGVMDGSNMYLYQDGVYLAQQTLGENIGDSAATVKIGTRGDFANYWPGSFGYTYIYNRALSASEIASLYIYPFQMFRRDPIELWTAASPGSVPPLVGSRTYVMGRNKCSYATKRCVARSFVNY